MSCVDWIKGSGSASGHFPRCAPASPSGCMNGRLCLDSQLFKLDDHTSWMITAQTGILMPELYSTIREDGAVAFWADVSCPKHTILVVTKRSANRDNVSSDACLPGIRAGQQHLEKKLATQKDQRSGSSTERSQ
eukprot:1156926-Pelagomonas_calceolata.AAC.1